MALLNNLYVGQTEESFSYETESSEHPVEKGLPLTDHMQRKPVTLSISGKIVDHKGMSANDIIDRIINLQMSGSLITYIGRTSATNLQIQSFQPNFSNKTWGGCDFSMTLKEIRTAGGSGLVVKQNSVTNGGTQQVSNGTNTNVYHIVKKGDTIWNLVTVKYKTLYPRYSKVMDKCNWVMSKNPTAFSRKGDFTTLQIGKKILIGYRK